MKEFDRTIKLIGKENFLKLKNYKIAIFGIGGVGGFVLESLVRSGIKNIDIYDNDIIEITNINRQIIALHSNLEKSKVEIAKKRALDINPELNINTYNIFYDKTNSKDINLKKYDYIVDAIDTVSSKLELIKIAKQNNIDIISCMGTGNKLNPTMLEITDIYKTSVCPLAKVIRKELKKENIKNLKVIYSKEEPIVNNKEISSMIFVPSVAGILIGYEIIKDIIK